MTKQVTPDGNIKFICICSYQMNGNEYDTLMYSEFDAEGDQGLGRNLGQVFIENTPHDTAAHVVEKDCLKCGLDYLNMVRISDNYTTLYRCLCGFQATHTEYERMAKKVNK